MGQGEHWGSHECPWELCESTNAFLLSPALPEPSTLPSYGPEILLEACWAVTETHLCSLAPSSAGYGGRAEDGSSILISIPIRGTFPAAESPFSTPFLLG